MQANNVSSRRANADEGEQRSKLKDGLIALVTTTVVLTVAYHLFHDWFSDPSWWEETTDNSDEHTQQIVIMQGVIIDQTIINSDPPRHEDKKMYGIARQKYLDLQNNLLRTFPDYHKQFEVLPRTLMPTAAVLMLRNAFLEGDGRAVVLMVDRLRLLLRDNELADDYVMHAFEDIDNFADRLGIMNKETKSSLDNLDLDECFANKFSSEFYQFISDNLVDPITNSTLKYPTNITPSGHTYNDSAIRHWMNSGHETEPVDRTRCKFRLLRRNLLVDCLLRYLLLTSVDKINLKSFLTNPSNGQLFKDPRVRRDGYTFENTSHARYYPNIAIRKLTAAIELQPQNSSPNMSNKPLIFSSQNNSGFNMPEPANQIFKCGLR